MGIKIKDNYVLEKRCAQVQAYLLSKALRNEDCTDDEIKKIYNISDADFDAVVDVLVKDGIVEKK